MTQPQVRDFLPGDLDAAARLLAARFARALEPLAGPETAVRDTAGCRRALESLASARYTRGVVATRGVERIGFLFAERVLTPPDSAQSYFNPAFSAASPLHGHAVAADEDPASVYSTLYAALAGDFVADGFLEHGVGVLASERELHDAWVELGFGRSASLAFRGVEPLAEATRTDLEIRQATEKELPEIFALLAEQRAFHARPPMFLPNLRILREPQEGLARALLGQPRCPTFVAYRGGRALGLQLFAPLSFISWPLRDDSTVYLFQGVVSERERGAGVGPALLQNSLAWMRRENIRRCGLHYLSANPSGAPFWTSHGFRPAEHFLHRTIDARMAWSAP